MAEKKSREWPAWRYGPDGEGKIFEKPEDVPKGWVDSPAKVKKASSEAKPNAGLAKEHGMSKKDIIAELEELEVEYDGRANADDLMALLLEASEG